MEKSLKLIQGEGAELDAYEVAAWVRRCFETANGAYFGTDSHVPSEYRELYADYLAAHSAYIDRTGISDSQRLLVVDTTRLRTDRSIYEKDFDGFLEWHRDRNHPVALKYLSPHDSDLIKNTNPSLASVLDSDIGFWDGDFMLLFNAQPRREAGSPPRIKLRISFAGEDLYAVCEQYVTILSKDNRVTDLITELPIYSPELSAHWRQFCDPDARIQQTGALLDQVLHRFSRPPEDLRIFDGACGIGIETVYLLKKKYHVISNEIESSLRKNAQEYASEKGIRIPEAQFTRADWLRLDDAFSEGTFDMAFVLGNSLCHLETEAQVQIALKQFYRIVRPGGYFICDERNFSFIQAHWNEISEDPWNFRFNQRPDRVMYRGQHVMGAPVQKDHNRLIFEYREVKRNGAEIVPNEEVLGSLSMLPFAPGSLKHMLEAAGFTPIEVLLDLQDELAGKRPEDSDWFTYIAQKPVPEASE